MTSIIPHAITFFLCFLVIIVSVKNLVTVNNYIESDHYKVFFYVITFFQIFTIMAFVGNQIIWIVDVNLVGTNIDIGWLAYDYLNKLFHLSTALWLRSIIMYETIDKQHEIYY